MLRRLIAKWLAPEFEVLIKEHRIRPLFVPPKGTGDVFYADGGAKDERPDITENPFVRPTEIGE